VIASSNWRVRGGRIIAFVFPLDALAYALKLAVPWRLVSTHASSIVVGNEIGLIVCILAFFGAAVCLRGWKMVLVVIASVVLGYFWLASILWWVMVR
jgi:hypothetical protein